MCKFFLDKITGFKYLVRKIFLYGGKIMAVSIHIIVSIVTVVALLVLMTWRVVMPHWKEARFKKTPLYKGIVEIVQEYNQNLVKPNPKSKIIRDNKVFISELVNVDIFREVIAQGNKNSDASQDFFVNIIRKHLEANYKDFIEYMDCVEQNYCLSHIMQEKIKELMQEHGIPSDFQAEVIAKGTHINEEEFSVVIELVISTTGKTLAERVDLPYEYIKIAFEQYDRATS
jgi:hypothetical protein